MKLRLDKLISSLKKHHQISPEKKLLTDDSQPQKTQKGYQIC